MSSAPPTPPPTTSPTIRPSLPTDKNSLLDLASCLTTSFKSADAETCRADPTLAAAGSRYPRDYDARVKWTDVSRTRVQLQMRVSAAEPTATFFAQVVGPSTLQAAEHTNLSNVSKDTFAFTFYPLEAGEHRIHLRLEYRNAAEAAAETGGPPGEFLGIWLPGSPFRVS